MALNCAAAVAAGGYALCNIQCEQGDVLGLFLEDNQRRLHSRMQQLLPNTPWPERLTLHTEWPRLNEGGLLEMDQWIQSVERPRLIVVDVLAKVRAIANGKNTPYADDYGALQPLQELAGKHRLAIVVITHDKKAKSEDDVLDNITGTLGQVGAADSAAVLQRGEGRADFLYIRGRDVPEMEYAVSFDKSTGLWRLRGNADDYRGNQIEIDIIKLLVAEGEPMKTIAICNAIKGASSEAIRVRLDRMAKAGTIRKLAGC